MVLIDMNLPESCDVCDFAIAIDGEHRNYCGFPGVWKYVVDYIACRPDFCPLQRVPERRHGKRLGVLDEEAWD